MKDSKLGELWQTLSQPELFRLRDYVRSPYFNKNKHVIALCEYLYKLPVEGPENKWDRQEVFRVLFPKKRYNDLKIRHLQSMLLKLAEDFLALEKAREQADLVTPGLAALRQRNLNKHYREAARKAQQFDVEPQCSALLHYRHLLSLELEQFEAPTDRKVFVECLQMASDRLDEYYLLEKLKLACSAATFQSVFVGGYEMPLQQEVLAYLSQTAGDHPVIIDLYYRGLQTLQTEPLAEKAYYELKGQLVQTLPVSNQELAQVHTLARNYCIRRLNAGAQAFIAELFEMYKLGLDRGTILNEAGQIAPGGYKNIVAVALKLRHFDWVEDFIHEYSSHLNVLHAEDYLNYNLAKLYFEKGQFQQAWQSLSQVDFHDVFVGADARTLLIKTYYELSEYGALDALTGSFKQYISRHRELAYHQENYLNFIGMVKRLSNLRVGSEKDIARFRNRLNGLTVLTEKEWLLAKVQQLE